VYGLTNGLFKLDCLSMRHASKVAGWLLIATITFLSLSPPSYRPVTLAGHHLEHFVIHVMLGMAFGIGYAKRLWLLALGLAAFTAVVEFAQRFIPGRHARLSDLLIDAGAACLGVVLAWMAGIIAKANA
jgi:VanZ family protein